MTILCSTRAGNDIMVLQVLVVACPLREGNRGLAYFVDVTGA